MKAVAAFALSFVRATLREGNTLFWYWIFPLLLLALLGTIFGSLERGEWDLEVSVVNLDRGPLGSELQRMLEDESRLLRLLPLPPGEGPAEAESRARREVAEGRVHAVLLIPPDFSTRLSRGSARVEILYRRGEASSSTAAAVLAEVVEEFGRISLVQTGLLKENVTTTVRMVGGEARTVRYAEFLLPGVILMAFFVTGIFGVPAAVVLAKEAGILRRYFAAPVSGGQYLLGLALGMAGVNGVQVLSLWALGRFGLGTRLPLLRPESLAFLFLAFATSMSLGFLISALSRTYHGAVALANLANLPLQFLGGLYFPVTSLPGALRILTAMNPLTHLAEGWRAALGLSTSAFPLWLDLLVPLLWLLGGAALAATRIGFLEGR